MSERRRDDAGTKGSPSGAGTQKPFEIEVGYDFDSAVYYVLSSDIPGLHIEAPTVEAFVDIAQDVAPDLVTTPGCEMRFTFRRTVDLAPLDGR